MKKTILFTIAILSVIALQFCSTSKKAASADKKAPMLSYLKDISPIMQIHCTPCHFPEQGGKKPPLDSYITVRNNIDSILYRVQLPKDDKKFMPFMSKKEPLSDSLIHVFIAWKDQGMPE